MIIHFQIEIAVIMDYMFNTIEKACQKSLQIWLERILMSSKEAKSSENDSRNKIQALILTLFSNPGSFDKMSEDKVAL